MKLAQKLSLIGITVILTCALVAINYVDQNSDNTIDSHGKAHYLYYKMMGIIQYPLSARRIADEMLQKGIRIEDIDFTLPEDSHYSQSNPFSIFQNKELKTGKLLPSPTSLEPSSFSGKFHYVFTGANKITAVGTDAPEILFIAWPLKEVVCHYLNQGFGLNKDWAETHVLDQPPDLTPYYHGGVPNQAVTEINIPNQKAATVVNISTMATACAQDKNGVRYYLQTIIER